MTVLSGIRNLQRNGRCRSADYNLACCDHLHDLLLRDLSNKRALVKMSHLQELGHVPNGSLVLLRQRHRLTVLKLIASFNFHLIDELQVPDLKHCRNH
jgi:hypothetical protein